MFDKMKDLKVFFRPSKVKIDGFVFSLHYKPTVGFLTVSAIIIFANWCFTNQISCIFQKLDRLEQFQRVAEDYCLLNSAFILPDSDEWLRPAHPGVRTDTESEHGNRKYQNYYQWVPFTCLLQALVFYIPHHIWVFCEKSRINMMTSFLKQFLVPEEEKIKQKKIIVDYIMKCLGKNAFYGYSYVLCEILNFANIAGLAYLNDLFLEKRFFLIGSEMGQILYSSHDKRSDPLNKLFPKVAKCIFNTYGPGGSVQPHDGLCVMPFNILYEKFYVVLWFWFAVLAVLSGLNIFFLMITASSKSFRAVQLRWRSPFTDQRKIQFISKQFQFGDWVLINLLGKNVEPSTYMDLLEDITLELKNRDYSVCTVTVVQ